MGRFIPNVENEWGWGNSREQRGPGTETARAQRYTYLRVSSNNSVRKVAFEMVSLPREERIWALYGKLK